ncbi:hypothetical protein VPH35_086966 [Triticum aestivum]
MAPIKINLAVDSSRNRVLFADAGSDFVDVLLSFLTLPLSALHFCAGSTSTPGCLSNLCDSVSRLRESRLFKVSVKACHDMLLTPSHEHEFCSDFCNKHRTLVKSQPHLQGHGELVHVYNIAWEGTFVRPKERFVISDDWAIKPASTSIMQSLPYMLSSDAVFHGFEEVEVCVGWAEAVSMLKASLSSDSIFTDVFLGKGTDDRAAARVTVKPSISRQKIVVNPNDNSGSLSECKIRLFYDRKEKKVMYAECRHEFVDLLLGFLAYPLGCVIKTTGATAAPSRKRNTTGSDLGRSSSFDNLYSSAVDLDATGFVSGGHPIETLLNPSRSPFSRHCSVVKEAAQEPQKLYMGLEPYSCCRRKNGGVRSTCYECHHNLVEDRKYVVDDDLQVHQASAMSVAKHWYMRDKDHVVETDVAIGKQEAVALLRAMLTSKTALTDVFISKLEEPPAAMIL